MSEQRPNLTINSSILERVYSEVKRTPNYEIGGRFFGKISEDGSLRVDEFIPTGPEPDSVSAVELLPDRRYQLWTLDTIREIEPDIDLFGSWHSHIPNGLERFSRQDYQAYYARMQPPYPHPGMLCGLIHTMPEGVADVKEHLLFAWYPADGEMGEHSFYEADEIEWVDTTLRKEITDLIHLTQHDQYQAATGRFQLTITDWHRAVDFIASSAIDPQHQIKQSPNGDRILIIETGAGDEGYALELTNEGNARCHLDDDEPTGWMTVHDASNMFENELYNWYDLPTEWSHLNRTLAALLARNDKEKTSTVQSTNKKSRWKFWLR